MFEKHPKIMNTNHKIWNQNLKPNYANYILKVWLKLENKKNHLNKKIALFWNFFSTPKAYKIYPVLIIIAKVMTIWRFV